MEAYRTDPVSAQHLVERCERVYREMVERRKDAEANEASAYASLDTAREYLAEATAHADKAHGTPAREGSV